MGNILVELYHGLIVSCQAEVHEPLHGAVFMSAMAKAAQVGGACAIRANSPTDISSIRATIDLPIIGIYKDDLPNFSVRITPTLEHARKVAEAGADIIALDATNRTHPDGFSATELICQIHGSIGLPVIADISNFEEGMAAADAGADAVATTLSGYTAYSPVRTEPDYELIASLAANLDVPVLAEGHIVTPGQAAMALEFGAYAVVVGSSITRPQLITKRFVEKMRAFQ